MPITGLKMSYGDLGIPIRPVFLFYNAPFMICVIIIMKCLR